MDEDLYETMGRLRIETEGRVYTVWAEGGDLHVQCRDASMRVDPRSDNKVTIGYREQKIHG